MPSLEDFQMTKEGAGLRGGVGIDGNHTSTVGGVRGACVGAIAVQPARAPLDRVANTVPVCRRLGAQSERAAETPFHSSP
jgi:hypothetical protein